MVDQSYNLSSITHGQILLDALWARDEFGGTGYTDPTSFETASKNGEDPAIWDLLHGELLAGRPVGIEEVAVARIRRIGVRELVLVPIPRRLVAPPVLAGRVEVAVLVEDGELLPL